MLGICSLAFLVVSAGISTIVSLICAVLAIIFGRKGRASVDEGTTRKHRGLAQAGFVMGIVGTALSVLATAFWIVVILVAEDLDDFQYEYDPGLDQAAGPILLRAVAHAARLLGA